MSRRLSRQPRRFSPTPAALARLETIQLLDAAGGSLLGVTIEGAGSIIPVTMVSPLSPSLGSATGPYVQTFDQTLPTNLTVATLPPPSPTPFALSSSASSAPSVVVTPPTVGDNGTMPLMLPLVGQAASATSSASGGGSSMVESVAYTPAGIGSDGSDASFSLDISYTDSYGSSSTGNSGSDTITIHASFGLGGASVTVTEDSNDNYNLSGTLVGSQDSGTWTSSGSDTFHYTDTFTLNADGTSTDLHSEDETTDDSFNLSDSAPLWGGGSYTLGEGGTNHLVYHEDNLSAGGAENISDVESATQNANLSETTSAGATVTASVKEQAGYNETDSPDANGDGGVAETVTTTDKGNEDYSFNGPVPMGDGGTDTASDAHGDTFNNNETITSQRAGGQVTQSTDTTDNSGTTYDHASESTSGVPDQMAPSLTDSISSSSDSSGTSSDHHVVSNGPGGWSDDETLHSTSSGNYSDSGTDVGFSYTAPGGFMMTERPFSASSSSATDITVTEHDGAIAVSNNSPSPTPGTSTGTPPSGAVSMDANMAAETASMTPQMALLAADGNSKQDQILLAQNQRQAPSPPAADPTTTLPKPVVADPNKLQNLTIDQLQKLLDNNNKLQEQAIKMAESYRSQSAKVADLGVDFEKVGLKLKLVYVQQFREWAGGILGNGKIALSKYYDFMAGYWTDVASQYGQNCIIINNVIMQKSMGGVAG